MTRSASLLSSSIGKKILMAGTGLFLCSFLVVHLLGHLPLLQMDDGAQAYNEYTKFMTTNPVIRVMEIGLLLGFLGHIIYGLLISVQNSKARPVKYAAQRFTAKNSRFARTMKWTGGLLLVFLVIHLKTFWFEYHFGAPEIVNYGGEDLKDMYTVVKVAFSQWWYSGFYVVVMFFMGFHLNHGFQSAFQSLGLNSPRYMPFIRKAGTAFAILMALGYAIFPAFMFLKAL